MSQVSQTVITVKEGGGLDRSSVSLRHRAYTLDDRQLCGMRYSPWAYFFFFFEIVNFAPETPRLQPEPVPASASETSPFVSA